ncbi:uncharacterized protein N7500_002151 [Penicillium coprophilum]|uniref:uncharacterized protein n=1 Tax=Penicillium coprophilum TaxID=36646 RepID=UPI00238EA11D|nr:uncharacterized protein N7500_002151 [Penicillium coprophilum]KAJ5169368.1 hypothetical protein N7500_002151 [Penicillium coprophilum]
MDQTECEGTESRTTYDPPNTLDKSRAGPWVEGTWREASKATLVDDDEAVKTSQVNHKALDASIYE